MDVSGGRTEGVPHDEGSLKRRIQWLLFFPACAGRLLPSPDYRSTKPADAGESSIRPAPAVILFSCILFAFTIVAALNLRRVQRPQGIRLPAASCSMSERSLL